MSSQRVSATYSAPLTFQATDLWEQFRAAIVSQLPLRNLHWKSGSHSSIRTVQELQIDLLPYETSGRDEHKSQILGSVLERPLLNIYIVACEDAEAYRTTVKKQIKDWHTQVTQKKNQEWLIVHVVSPETTRIAPGTFLKMKATVIDKVRADFNVDKRDRCVQLAWSNDKDSPAAWVDLITKMKEGILTAFDSVVSQREEEVKRSEGQRQMPGWNFCTYFILKEGLANLFEGMSLFEDALSQYDELQSTFFQVLREKNLSWFGSLISPAPKDDSQPLLSLTKKPYRDLILANTISIFDFRIYLLARQCTILGRMGRVVEASKKSSSFLASFSRRLREVEGRLPKFFIESWTYSSALSVVDQCDAWAGPSEFDKLTSSNFRAAKGELMQLAANQLDIIGISVGHLPSEIPFSMSIPFSAPVSNGVPDNGTLGNVTKPEIVSAIADKDVFYDLYVNVTKRAIDLYGKSGRRQFALKLHGTLASLDVHRTRLAKAHQTYASLPAHYVPHGWNSLGCYMHYQAMKLHSKLGKPKDREWVNVMLDFLKAYVGDLSQEFITQEEDKTEYISGLMSDLRTAASELDSDIPYPDHPAIIVRVLNNQAELAETQDGSFLTVTIQNQLPAPILVDQFKVTLTGPEAERMVFVGEGTTLKPGSVGIKLLCPSSTSGPFLLEKSEIRLSKVLLQWNHKQKQSHSRLVKEIPTVIHVPKDPQAVDVFINQPQSIELGAPQKVHVTVSTGRNEISHMRLRFSSHPGIKFDYTAIKFIGKEDVSNESAEDAITLQNLEKETSISFLLPHSDAASFNAIKVNVKVEYVTVAEPSIDRVLRLSRVVPTLLAVAVNVEDFFRGKKLFTRFTISTTSHQHVRIRSAQLELAGSSEDDLRIIPCASRKHELVTVTPSQAGNFLFRLESIRGQVSDPLRLRITYRVFRKEVEALIENSVNQVLAILPTVVPHRKIIVDSLVKALERDAKWVELYGITGQLDAPTTQDLDGELGDALQKIKELLLKNDSRLCDDAETWREIIFPVDVPHMNIIAAVRVKILSKSSLAENNLNKIPPLYAGQPIAAVLSIRTSFHWGPGSELSKKDKTYVMRFDVEELLKDWLVSGQKRGDFVAKDGGTFQIPITLVALHHGELSLPRASVTPLPIAGGEMTMGSVNLPGCDTYQEHGAEKVLVLPRGGRSTFFVGMGGNA